MPTNFDLAPQGKTVDGLAAGTHVCWLAAGLCRADHPGAGPHVWEHNDLAQKNLTVVDVIPGRGRSYRRDRSPRCSRREGRVV